MANGNVLVEPGFCVLPPRNRAAAGWGGVARSEPAGADADFSCTAIWSRPPPCNCSIAQVARNGRRIERSPTPSSKDGFRPKTRHWSREIVALKRPVVVCGRLSSKYMKPSRIAGSAQMPLDKSVPLIRRFRRLIKIGASSCSFIFSRGEFT
jgi:hypothetical protein